MDAMEQSKYEIIEPESAFSKCEIHDETCRFGDWQHHVAFGLKNSPWTTTTDPTDVQHRGEDSTGSPIATQTRVP
jgi:hypothetical protein